MILDEHGRPFDAHPAEERGPDAYEKRLTNLAFVESLRADVGYELLEGKIADAMFAGAEPGPRAALTRRQRARIAWSRYRAAIARPLVGLANWISPGVASEDCDC